MSYANIHKIRPPRPKWTPQGQGIKTMGYVPHRPPPQANPDQPSPSAGLVPPAAPPLSDVSSTAFDEWAFAEKVGVSTHWINELGAAIVCVWRFWFPLKPAPIEIRVYDFSESPSLCGSWKVD